MYELKRAPMALFSILAFAAKFIYDIACNHDCTNVISVLCINLCIVALGKCLNKSEWSQYG
jgi:hypothetical protein